MIFERFARIESATTLARQLIAEGVTNKLGKPFDKGAIYKLIYKLIYKRVYLGEVTYKGEIYPGEHAAIIDRALWDRVHGILKESPRKRANRGRA